MEDKTPSRNDVVPYRKDVVIKPAAAETPLLSVPNSLYTVEAASQLKEAVDSKRFSEEHTKTIDYHASILKDSNRPNPVMQKFIPENPTQGLLSDGYEIKVRTPKIVSPSGELSIEDMLTVAQEGNGKSSKVRIPLPHSGMRLTFDPIPIGDQLQFQTRMAEENVKLGQMSNALIWSEDDAVSNIRVVRFIMGYMTGATLRKDKNKTLEETVLGLLVPQDIYPLVTGMLKSMYPNGYPFRFVCVHSKSTSQVDTGDGPVDRPDCNYDQLKMEYKSGEEVPHLIFDNMYRYENEKFTDADRVHLRAVDGAHSSEVVKEYQAKIFENLLDELPTLGSEDKKQRFSIRPKVPNFLEIEAYNSAWLDMLMNHADRSLVNSASLSASDFASKEAMTLSIKIKEVAAGRLGSWISEIVTRSIDDEGEEQVGYAKCENAKHIPLLERLSSDPETRIGLLTQLTDFQARVTFGFPAIAAWDCPDCHRSQASETAEDKSLIPFDPVSCFLNIMVLHHMRRTMIALQG